MSKSEKVATPDDGGVLAELRHLAAFAPRDDHMDRLEAVIGVVAELIAADKEYDEARAEYNAKAPSGIGELDSRTDEDYERFGAAKARRAAALSNIEGGKASDPEWLEIPAFLRRGND